MKTEKVSRSNYIKIAIEQYNGWQKRKALKDQITREVKALKDFDPDKELKEEFEIASQYDLQKHTGE